MKYEYNNTTFIIEKEDEGDMYEIKITLNLVGGLKLTETIEDRFRTIKDAKEYLKSGMHSDETWH